MLDAAPLSHAQSLALSEDAIASHDWSTSGPVSLEVWHGTTHAFDAFTLDRAVHDGQFGKVLYFTSSEYDARHNYASPDGPDLKNKIEQAAERLQNEIWDAPGCFDLDEDHDQDDIDALATKLAHAQHVGSTERVIPVFLELDRPFVIDHDRVLHVPMYAGRSSWDEAIEAVAEEQGITVADLDPDDFEDEIYQEMDELREKRYREIADTLRRICHEHKCPYVEPDLMGEDLDEISCSNFEKLFRSCEEFSMLENEEGVLIGSTVFSQLISALGFDSIVLLNADRRFQSMSMDGATTHIHIFDPKKVNLLA